MVFYSDKVTGGYKVKMLPIIMIEKALKNDKGLKEHELTHVYQYLLWFVVVGGLLLATTNWFIALIGGAVAHDLMYTLVKPYRQFAEVMAFKRQLKADPKGDINKAARHLADDYGLGITQKEALKLLK